MTPVAQDLERLYAPHRALALDRLDRAVHSAVRRVVDRHRVEVFPRVFLPGPGEVWQSFVSLT